MTIIDQSTRLIKVGQTSEDSAYPVYMQQVRTENPSWSFAENPEEQLLRDLGYFVVELVTQPSAENAVAVEGQPVFENGVWKQSWTLRQHTEPEIAAAFETKKHEQLTAIMAKVTEALAKGFQFTFDDGIVGHVQLRDGDRANLAGARVRAEAFVEQNVTDAIMPFRDWENVTHMCTPATIVTLADKAYDAYLGFLAIGWELKDQTEAATQVSELPALPAEIELPAAT